MQEYLFIVQQQCATFLTAGDSGTSEMAKCQKCFLSCHINLLTPNVNYSGRTAPLTSKVAFYIFIQEI